ncbi:peptide chain release factor N(5)-glutamine methyltransferase [Paraliobacillus sp. PM-2]|uniref:peptide chain release factor N(5)-glutamine methyltransferase n=1 Tax=Paraliobacillus sp. PM-2 TaxID=1462524 RepID=UPI000B891669|nr:peptide chain release factor N(5)-glutamine methyltransferase [Paraliobacillus sp. PM-2]
MTQPNLQEVLRRASLFLEQNNREPRIAELLLMHHLQLDKTQLLMQLRQSIAEPVYQAYQRDMVKHVETGVPIQHLIGYESFYGRKFNVNKDVLIPRPETEELVLGTLEKVKQLKRPLRVVDVGTGSGIIAITLKLEDPTLDVHALDISEAALTVAQANAKQHHANVSFAQSDFLQSWINQGNKADVIISNPPYIPWKDSDTLSDTVKNFDPSLALFADDNGLYAYQQLIEQAEQVLSTCGLLAFEIGYQQGEEVKARIQAKFPNSDVEIRKDINGKDRMVFATL